MQRLGNEHLILFGSKYSENVYEAEMAVLFYRKCLLRLGLITDGRIIIFTYLFRYKELAHKLFNV